MVIKINDKPILVQEEVENSVNWVGLGMKGIMSLLCFYLLDTVSSLFGYPIHWMEVLTSWF